MADTDGTVSTQADATTLPGAPGTSQESPIYTESQFNKKLSDTLAAKGRDDRSLTVRKEALEAREKEWEDAEVERLQGNEEELSLFQRKQAQKKREVEWQWTVDEAKRIKEENESFKRERKALEIASQYGVDSTLLLTLTDGTPEKMEALAKALPKLTPEAPKKTLRTDSGAGYGGAEDLSKLTARQLAERGYAPKK